MTYNQVVARVASESGLDVPTTRYALYAWRKVVLSEIGAGRQVSLPSLGVFRPFSGHGYVSNLPGQDRVRTRPRRTIKFRAYRSAPIALRQGLRREVSMPGKKTVTVQVPKGVTSVTIQLEREPDGQEKKESSGGKKRLLG